MDIESNNLERKIKLASNYFIYSILFVAAILFLIYSFVEIFRDFFGRMSPWFSLILGLYLLFAAMWWMRLKIKRGY